MFENHTAHCMCDECAYNAPVAPEAFTVPVRTSKAARALSVALNGQRDLSELAYVLGTVEV